MIDSKVIEELTDKAARAYRDNGDTIGLYALQLSEECRRSMNPADRVLGCVLDACMAIRSTPGAPPLVIATGIDQLAQPLFNMVKKLGEIAGINFDESTEVVQ